MKRKLLVLCLLCLLTACGGPAYSAEACPPAAESPGGDRGPKRPRRSGRHGLCRGTAAKHDNGGNILLSPISVLSGLAMTANGAAGETKTQMEETLGLPVEEFNAYLQSYAGALPESEEARCSLANSVWFRDDAGRLTVEQAFLDACAGYYGADLFQAPFDETTLADLNAWVSDHTDGMIPTILDRIPDSAMVYLVNALAFDGQWASVYRENQIHEGTFTAEDGTRHQPN
jgi:serpin B